MKQTKPSHTPGAWYYCFWKTGQPMFKTWGEGAGQRVFLSSDITREGALCIGELYTNRDGWEKDARLITAAPDLLSVLKDLVDRCDGDEGVRADGSNIQTMRAHAVIAHTEERR